MYFPYLRCKQFELLALRDICTEVGAANKISPILEPVKKATTGLVRALKALEEANFNFTIIINPSVGEFIGTSDPIVDLINKHLSGYNNYQVGVIINQNNHLAELNQALAKLVATPQITLIYLGRPSSLDLLLGWVADKTIRFNVYGENIQARRYRELITTQTKILLEDNFNAEKKNADYIEVPEEIFSDEHLYYKEDNFQGFSDYLTIGSSYLEGGFLPYAVAIHFTYINRTDNSIWIRHFVSDSNTNNINVAGKFGEALEKLMIFIDDQDINTRAAEEFRVHYHNQHYPGLGSIKKLSIQNHLELLLELLT